MEPFFHWVCFRADAEQVDCPRAWISWPTKTYWLPGKMEDYYDDLLIMGNWDNENIQMQLTFSDKIQGVRRLFVRVFGTPAGYANANKERQS